MHRLDPDLARRMARLAIDNIGREYPNAPGHVLRSAADLRPPRVLHPAFYGSFDWHSSVHQHWLLARVLRLRILPTDAEADVRQALGARLTEPNLRAEATYLRERPSFERTYGWAWLLRLADELASLDDRDAERWHRALAPAVDAVRTSWLAHLPRATYPIRAGTHANSAFGLTFAVDHARAVDDETFATAIGKVAAAWFAADRDYPAHLEPGGDDFLSGTLVEALLMSRLLDRPTFAAWLADFLPAPPDAILEPATVSDRSDPKTAHLDGLNFSRAWCWLAVAEALGSGRTAALANAAATRHLDAAMPHLFSGEYAAEHWVASFALLALT